MADDDRTDGAWLGAYAEQGDEQAFENLYRKYADMVYSVCLRQLGNTQDAEEAAAACFVVLHRKAGTIVKRERLATWLYSCATMSARAAMRRRMRRAAREKEGAAMDLMRRDESADGWAQAMLPRVEMAVAKLPSQQREALILHFYRKMPLAGIAASLGCPEGTVASRIGRALDALRKTLAKRGAQTSREDLASGMFGVGLLTSAPAGLWGKVRAAVRGGPGSETVGEVADMTRNRMVLEQFGRMAGVAAAGVLLAAAGVMAAGREPGAAPVAAAERTAAEAPKFEWPVWHPEVRWVVEEFAGCGVGGHLDGPRKEMQNDSVGAVDRFHFYRTPGAGRYAFGAYLPDSERGHVVAGSARGYLDGPFTRARMGGWDYVTRSTGAVSPDGRFRYFTDGYNRHVLRCLDLKEQQVRTLLPDTTGLRGLVADSRNRLYVLGSDGRFMILFPDGTTEPGFQAEMREKIGHWGASLALDEKRGRIYATTFRTEHYYIWYWNIADGSFHGVLPTPEQSGKDRGRNVPGSFDGVNLYNQGSVFFGPDDEDRRFLYTGRVDTWNLFRLDLEQREIRAFEVVEGGRRGPPRIVRFSDTTASGRIPFYGGGTWLNDGSFISTVHSPYIAWRFRRIR